MKRRKSLPTRRAFMMADVLIGLGVIAVLAGVLASGMGRARLSEQRLADSRAAHRIAEHVLLNLQHEQPMPQLSSEAHVSLRKAKGGEAPAGFIWGAVAVTLHGRHATLVGIVPVDAASKFK